MGFQLPDSAHSRPPEDGIDRCHWLACYEAANGGGELFCERHEQARGAELLRQALHAADDLGLS